MKRFLLILALLLPACDDHSRPQDMAPHYHRTEGPRDVSEPWERLEERPQANGDMFTKYGRPKDGGWEIRWEHRKGLSTRFVPREERIPQ